MRFIGLDVHREFCEVAIAEEGSMRNGEVDVSAIAYAHFASDVRRALAEFGADVESDRRSDGRAGGRRRPRGWSTWA